MASILILDTTTLAGLAIGRLFGLIVDGFSATHLSFAALEVVGAAFCLAGCVIVSREKKHDSLES